jgi:hypothetical protein
VHGTTEADRRDEDEGEHHRRGQAIDSAHGRASCDAMRSHAIDALGELLERFLAYGETTTSIINASPVPGRSPPPVAD